jgi:hypothetical protein
VHEEINTYFAASVTNAAESLTLVIECKFGIAEGGVCTLSSCRRLGFAERERERERFEVFGINKNTFPHAPENERENFTVGVILL